MKTPKELYELSAIVGKILQFYPNILPVDALSILIITIGRLMAREGYADIDKDAAWNILQQCKELFLFGFEQERIAGHKGVPRNG